MKKLLMLFSFAAALAMRAAASPAPDVTLRVTPERDFIYRLGPREVIVQVEIEARRNDEARRSPMNLCIVLDRSGSMEGAKLEKARQAAAMAVDKLSDDDILSVVTYDNETNLLIAPERVGNTDHREDLKSRIHRIQAGGSTALGPASDLPMEIAFGKVRIDCKALRGKRGEERIELSPRELKVLSVLFRERGNPVSREALLNEV